ncbi:hypothetical protein BDW74DRAFT_174955 [Aspergillus multicolor]|uniref:uncharacterized protein n=1 Tax=Aspergillus multicolor TaxID=41759 RepID=UPI003CCDD72C
MPVQSFYSSAFTEECVSSAKAALRSHQAFIVEFGVGDSIVLAGHITWSILFVPFVPFIILFGHSIETGDVEDLDSMWAFVASIQSACPHSPAIAKHYRLFQVFCNVATRYCELKARPTSLQPEQLALRMELDSQLSTFGFQPPPLPPLSAGNGVSDEGYGSTVAAPISQGGDASGDMFSLGDWFSFSQNMMALLDNNNV